MTNLLTLAKLDEDTKLPLAETDISSLIQASLSAYTYIAETCRLKLRCDIQPAIILKTHRDTFMQMISILVDNAFKYTPDGGEIFFCLKSNGGKIELVEENTCTVVVIDDPERLFERLYRVDSARTQSGAASGFGIGLSAARAIAETFGGKLNASCPAPDKIRFTAKFQ